LVNDDIESCGNGYNGEEKEPEFVLVDLGGAYHELIEAPAAPTTSDSSAASSSSSESNNENTNANSQSQTVVVCPAGKKVNKT
jgi:hypothetical protein